MSNAERLLRVLDAQMNAAVELTLYGRAALQLGFADPLEEFGASRDRRCGALDWPGRGIVAND